MATPPEPQTPIDDVGVLDAEHWVDGPPLALFERLRGECPVHWSKGLADYPEEPGFWSVTTTKDMATVSRDWRSFSSELGGMLAMPSQFFPLEIQNAMFIGMDPPKHDRLKALFNRGFTPKRIAQHEEEIRTSVRAVLDGLAPGQEVDLVHDVAQPMVSRVIGRFMGIEPEDDAGWAKVLNAVVSADDPELNPEGPGTVMERDMPLVIANCQGLIAARRAEPREDLMTVLVEAEVDGERLTDHEIVMGFVLLMVAGNDSTKAVFCSGMRAVMQDPEQRRLLHDDPTLVPDAVEESLRMFPSFAHFRRTATKDVELAGCRIKTGDKVVMWYPSAGREEALYEDANRFDLRRRAEHIAFGAGGRHFCLGTALARLELEVMFQETLARFPQIALRGNGRMARAVFVNQLTSLPVRL